MRCPYNNAVMCESIHLVFFKGGFFFGRCFDRVGCFSIHWKTWRHALVGHSAPPWWLARVGRWRLERRQFRLASVGVRLQGHGIQCWLLHGLLSVHRRQKLLLSLYQRKFDTIIKWSTYCDEVRARYNWRSHKLQSKNPATNGKNRWIISTFVVTSVRYRGYYLVLAGPRKFKLLGVICRNITLMVTKPCHLHTHI